MLLYTERTVCIPNSILELRADGQHRHQNISWAESNGFVGMNYPRGLRSIVSTFVLILGVIIFTNPVLGYSRLLPGGMFELIFGGLLLASGLLLYQVGASID
jgi:hypothetical protein